MATPAIQTLLTDAQQVLNLNSLSEVRATMAAALANANVGTPLNPNLTTQQLWDEFYLIVRQPESDIESIITNQLMKFLYAPPAPGGVGADGQVIFNDGGVLAGDPQFLWNKTTNLLTVTGSATISGDLTVDTNVLKVNTTTNRVGINTTTPTQNLQITGSGDPLTVDGCSAIKLTNTVSGRAAIVGIDDSQNFVIWNVGTEVSETIKFLTGGGSGKEQYRITHGGVFNWYDGAGSTRMTLNATGLGVGVAPANDKLLVLNSIGINTSSNGDLSFRNIVGTAQQRIRYSDTDGSLTIGSAQAVSYAIYFGGNTTTRAMTLDASGNLIVNGTTQFAKISSYVTNSGTFQSALGATNGSNSDFVVRIQTSVSDIYNSVGNLTLSTGGSGGTERVRVKTTGQVRFVPLAADPAGAEAGDVYYNSSSNKLKCYNGTTWNDLF